MKLRAEFVISIGLLCLMLPGSLRADTVYTYTGNAYNICDGTYSNGTHGTCRGTYALSVTFDTVLTGVNLVIGTIPGGDLSPYVASFAFTDGAGFSLTYPTAQLVSFDFDATTDGSGNLLAGDIKAYYCNSFLPVCQVAYPVEVAETLSYGVDFVGISQYPYGGYSVGVGESLNDPGTWVTTTAPGTGVAPSPYPATEPATAILMLIGVALVLVMRKRIAQGRPQAT
jgi:hypothetical protein